MVIEHAPLEDELGDILDKAMCHAGMNEHALADRSGVTGDKIHDAIDYRYDFTDDDIGRLAEALGLNARGLQAIAKERYPLPEIAGLPFCLYPLRFTYGIGVANAYIVADCCEKTGLLFDCGPEYPRLRRLWPRSLKRLDAIFITHSETEHVGGLKELMSSEDRAPLFCPEEDRLEGAVALGEGASLTFGRIHVKVFKTPGHCEAHNCYLVTVTSTKAAAPLLITGDTLFAGSVGKAFYCRQRLTENIRRMFAELPENTVVAPGHGPLTTLKNERLYNPFVV